MFPSGEVVAEIQSADFRVGSAGLDPAGVDLAGLIAAVNQLDGRTCQAGFIDQITLLEHLKSSCAAAQGRLTHTFTAARTAHGAAHGHRVSDTQRSIAAQIALARSESRYRGARLVGLADALIGMPAAAAALQAGQLSEHRAELIVSEFACLTAADRARADQLIQPDLPGLGDKTASSRAAGIADRLDPAAVMHKVRGAVTGRHVSLRPAPSAMTRFSALLPAVQGVAVHAALLDAATTAMAAGDPRTRGQVMADDLVSRVTGQTMTGCDDYGVPEHRPNGPEQHRSTDNAPDGRRTDPHPTDNTTPGVTDNDAGGSRTTDNDAAGTSPYTAPDAEPCSTGTATAPTPGASATPDKPGTPRIPDRPAVGLAVNLIMTDRTLFGDDDEPAHLAGYGPIPAPLARALVIGQADTDTRTFLRRLYTDPTTGQLLAMDSRQRLFPPGAQRFLIARDQTCRTPWCDAPIKHADHIIAHARGGPTDLRNGQGLCQACNLSKAAPGWTSTTETDGTVHLTTPTGHRYPSRPPRPPTSPPWPDISPTETRLTHLLLEVA